MTTLHRLTREIPAWKKFQDLLRLAADLSLLPAPNEDPTTFVKVPWLLLSPQQPEVCGSLVAPSDL